MTQLTLVSHHLCPYVQRAAIALAEKSVPFERVLVDLAAKPAWFAAISPLGKVPLLQVRQPDGSSSALFESAAICEYIEETQPGPRLHPDDPIARAQHRGWMECGTAILTDIWGLETTPHDEMFRTKQAALATKFARVETTLSDGPYFAGERFNLVDAVFGPIFRYFDVFDTITDLGLFTTTPKIRRWRSALAQRPSVAAAVDADYADRLRAFLTRHDAHMLRLAA